MLHQNSPVLSTVQKVFSGALLPLNEKLFIRPELIQTG